MSLSLKFSKSGIADVDIRFLEKSVCLKIVICPVADLIHFLNTRKPNKQDITVGETKPFTTLLSSTIAMQHLAFFD